MTEPSTGAGGTAVGMVTVGDRYWMRVIAVESQSGGLEFMNDLSDIPLDAIPDSPALRAVAAWLAEVGDDVLTDLADAAVFCLDEGGSIVHDDPAYQMRLIAAGRALIAALATDGGA